MKLLAQVSKIITKPFTRQSQKAEVISIDTILSNLIKTQAISSSGKIKFV